MIKKVIPLCLMVISIVLMALPFGVAISFYSSDPPDVETITRYYSYFDIFVIGASGNVFPSVIAYFSIGMSIGLLFGLFMKKRPMKDKTKSMIILFIFLFLLPFSSILSWVIFNSITVIAVIVFILHIASILLSMYVYFKERKRKLEIEGS